METFRLAVKHGRGGRVYLTLSMVEQRPGSGEVVVRDWKLPWSEVEKIRIPLGIAERLGVLFNGLASSHEKFDGSAREFIDLVSERGHKIDEFVVEHAEGMILAMAFMLAGRCNTTARKNAVRDGLTNLEPEVLLYWFTLCAYGWRQKAGQAALFALFTTRERGGLK